MTRHISACLIVSLFAAGAAHAQTAQTAQPATGAKGRLFVSADGGGQLTSTSAEATVTYKVYGEDATMKATYTTKAVPAFGGRAGIRIWKRLTVGGAISRVTDSAGAPVTARVPHPFYFQSPRQVDGTAEGILREETVTYAELGWTFSLSRRLDLMLLAGPAFFTARQEVATKVLYAETYPYDAAAFTGVESTVKKATVTGYTVGADLTYMFTRTVGAGALVRFSRASMSVDPVPGQKTTVDLGGLQAGAGIRIRF